MACGKKFTYDAGKLTAYSHQSKDKCAEQISVSHTTAFFMRQKLQAVQDDMLYGLIEADEAYALEA